MDQTAQKIEARQLHGSCAKAYHEVMAKSWCKVDCIEDDDGLAIINLSYRGYLSKMPAKSNGKRIYTVNRGGRNVPFIANSGDVVAQIEAMKSLYFMAVANRFQALPSFGDQKVHVHVSLANRSGRWDSHNTTKAIGDLIEELKIVANDSQCQIWTQKKDFIVPERDSITEIKIIRWDKFSMLNANINKEVYALCG